MNQDPSLKPTFQELTNEAKAAWNAVSMLLPTAYGAIAVAQEGASQRNGAASHLKLHFALEIAGTALLGHLPNGDITRYEVLFKDCLLPGYQHAINCVYVLVREYLWDRFV